jgi:hypothetical protein
VDWFVKSVSCMVRQKRTRSPLVITLLHEGCIGLIALGSALYGSASIEARASPPALSVRPTVTASADGLLVDWRAPEASIVSRADGTVDILLPGYAQTALPGAPALPYISVLVAVPPGAMPALRVVLVEETDRPLPGPLALAPFPAGVQRDAAGLPIGGDFSPAPSAQLTQSNEGESVVLESAGVTRGVPLARLVFYPARPVGNAPQARLRLTTHVRVSLTFAGQGASLSRAASPDPLFAALRSAVINPEQVQPVASTLQNPPAESQTKIQNLNDAGSAWTIQVTMPGLTAITYEALAGVGFPVASADPHSLHLARAGTEIAAEWDGDGDASFEPGERLLFYAEPRFSRWTSTDVYILWQNALPLPLRMQSRPAGPIGNPVGIAWADETVEVNQLYTPDCFCGSIPAGRDGDHWTWDDLKRPGHSTASYSINLPALDATQPATLTLWLIGYTDVAANPDHRVDVSLNGASVGHIAWNAKQAITTTLLVTPGILHRDANTLTLTLPGIPGVGIEGTWLDAFSIRYARGSAPSGRSVILTGQPAPKTYTLALSTTTGLRVYDVTNPDMPLRLTGVITVGNMITFSDPSGGGSHRYALTTNSGLLFPVALRPAQPLQTSGVTGADYVMIAPIDFIPALNSLITLRQSQGLTVAVENVQAIYEAYGDGRPDPAAIRAYLAHAYAAWTLRPTYVVLVGDGSFDPRQYRTGSPATFIPPYLADVDPWAGETATDNRYVTVDGADTLPDMLIGRLPVKTLTETQAMVKKIVQYETNPFPGGWNEHVTFVADNADEAGNFAAASEMLATTYVTSPFTSQRIYFTPPATTMTTTRQAVSNQWNAGAFIVQYTGHSSWQQWAAERFLHLDDLPALHNDRRWPIVLEMTCFTGAFQRPEPTLDEGLLTLNGGGVVAAWGATGLGISTGHSNLDDGFFRAVFSDTVSTLGQATWAGKLSLAATGQHLDLLDTFTLLGDPALRLNRTIIPWASRNYLPIVMRNQNTLER